MKLNLCLVSEEFLFFFSAKRKHACSCCPSRSSSGDLGAELLTCCFMSVLGPSSWACPAPCTAHVTFQGSEAHALCKPVLRGKPVTVDRVLSLPSLRCHLSALGNRTESGAWQQNHCDIPCAKMKTVCPHSIPRDRLPRGGITARATQKEECWGSD